MKIINLEETDSTMNEVKKYDFNTVVVAEKQTSGRGKGSRNWVSEKSNNIYMSLLIKADNDKINYFNYSFLTAVAVIKSIENLTNDRLNLKAKWPNDVLINDKKICGILLEKDGEKLVIGVGINVDKYPENVLFNSTSLKNEGVNIDKSTLLNEFVKNFEEYSKELNDNGFENIRKTWLKYAYHLGEKIIVSNRDNLEGIFKDLDEDGTLILESASGEISKISSGDIF